MSSSYYLLSRARTRLEKLIQIASTASFEEVRLAYLTYSIDDISKRAHGVHTYEGLAQKFTTALKSVVLKGYPISNEQQTQWNTTIMDLLQKPGSPYEKVGYVLDWFKTTRAKLRTEAKANGATGDALRFDTNHSQLQCEMSTLLENLCYRMLADNPVIPEEELLAWTKNDDRPQRPNGGMGLKTKALRSMVMERSQKTRQQIEKAPPWAILMDWNWRTSLRANTQSVAVEATAPPTYVLTQYMLRATPETFSREHVVQAMVMERVHYDSSTRRLQSGSELGIPVQRPVANYEQWWSKEEKKAARDWRHIRRTEVGAPYAHSIYIENATLGDAMARLRKNGPEDIVLGVFSRATPEVKALMLDRLHLGLGQTYMTLKQVEDTVGSMPDSIIQTLNDQLHNVQTPHMDLTELGLF